MAISGNDFLFLHPVKTGGTWVEDRLAALFPGAVTNVRVYLQNGVASVQQHLTLADAQASLKDSTELVISVRHPLTWYGSLYLHASKGPNGKKRLAMYGNGEVDFRSALFGMTHPAECQVPDYPIMLTTSGAEQRISFSEGSEGLYAHHMGLYSHPEARLLRQESLNFDFDAWRGTETQESPRLNVTQRASAYEDWYDDEMVEWVRDADGQMAERLGYTI